MTDNLLIAIAEYAATTNQNVQKVYDAGYEKGFEEASGNSYYDIFWDNFQNNGSKRDYGHAFRNSAWNDQTFKPKYDIVCDQWGAYLFTNSKITDLKGILESQGVVLDTSRSTAGTNFFSDSTITKIPPLDCSAMTSCGAMFNNCIYLTDVELNNVREELTGNNMFGNCTELVNLKITGTIGANGWRFNDSNKLSHESLLNIFNVLKDYSADTSGTSWVMTLGATNLAKLSDNEKLIATNKGWTLA